MGLLKCEHDFGYEESGCSRDEPGGQHRRLYHRGPKWTVSTDGDSGLFNRRKD